VGGRLVAACQPIAGVLHQQGLGPRGDSRKAELLLRVQQMKLLEGKPLQLSLIRDRRGPGLCYGSLSNSSLQLPESEEDLEASIFSRGELGYTTQEVGNSKMIRGEGNTTVQ
jgi:hypothetical protein